MLSTFLGVEAYHEKVFMRMNGGQVSVSDSTEFLAVVSRSLVMGWSCYLANTDCVQRADQLFQAWTQAEDYENRSHLQLVLPFVLFKKTVLGDSFCLSSSFSWSSPILAL